MSHIKIVIDTDNDAFRDKGEVRRILNKVIDNLEDDNYKFSVNDINGNKVCEVIAEGNE